MSDKYEGIKVTRVGGESQKGLTPPPRGDLICLMVDENRVGYANWALQFRPDSSWSAADGSEVFPLAAVIGYDAAFMVTVRSGTHSGCLELTLHTGDDVSPVDTLSRMRLALAAAVASFKAG